MQGEYLFRALSKKDLDNYGGGKNIECKSSVKNYSFDVAIKDAKVQVASGSTIDTSWISTSKDFFTCSEEYSIPQMGGFNNAKCRRRIAIISRNDEIGTTNQYKFNNINCTYIKSNEYVLDLGDWSSIILVESTNS